ncbi:MAG: glycosyltransferase family 2 protein [Candidatus Saccharimonadales bacterium]
MRNVSVIVPVYGDWESLQENIKHLKKSISCFSNWEVLFVNDCGPEADTLELLILGAIKGRKNFKYFRNDENLGFVKNCNRAAFELCNQENDIVLLNSDALVTKGALQNMHKILYAQSAIGAVCPRSNAATIFSVPMKPKPGTTYTMKESYKIYKKIRNKLPEYYESPIAHGFCMMIRREVIEEYGLFDEAYGKGYGEENDFCMRIRREGWKCAVANGSYAFHYKARSFTEEKRTEQVKKNERILDERYPEYRGLIREYVASINEPVA